MKLEIKHLAPYLPHDLPIKVLNHKSDYTGVEYSFINGYYYLGGSLHVTYKDGNTGKSVSEFKPILKPLDDLNESDLIKEWDKEHTIRYGLFGISMKLNGAETIDLSHFPLQLITNLFEHHFDVFGLIDQGLAININDLNQKK